MALTGSMAGQCKHEGAVGRVEGKLRHKNERKKIGRWSDNVN